MAITPFGRGKNPAQSGQSTTIAAASSSSNSGSGSSSAAVGGLTAFIDQGSEFEGKLSFRDTVRIDGKFCGEITSENTLIVGESGEIDADIHSKTVSISGTVSGNVIAEAKVVLHKTALVNGNIETPSLVVEEGARVNGQINMNASPNKTKAVLKPVASDAVGDEKS
ncbi:MAG: polymer-forming cytoskeletal protein [Myxococcota bacterium]